jgi:hypothetical protein
MDRIFFVGVTLALTLIACGGGSNGAGSDTSTTAAECADPVAASAYLMAFHACDTAVASCSDPRNHTIYLAASDDGAVWRLVESFEPRNGSVPDIAFHDGSLYLFHTGTAATWVSYNACLAPTGSGSVALTSDTDTAGFVDPSLIVLDGTLTLFYLPGVLGADPAGCGSYPCQKEIHSAVVTGGNPSTMTQVPGARIAETLTSGVFSDPDIVRRADGTYLLYVSSGQSTLVYTGADPSGAFTATGDPISDNSGGVPTALANDDGSVWLYVTKTDGGREVIRRAASADGTTPLADASFATVVDAGISTAFGATVSVSSPSVIAWPTGWNR